jgi:hypothetical protein
MHAFYNLRTTLNEKNSTFAWHTEMAVEFTVLSSFLID